MYKMIQEPNISEIKYYCELCNYRTNKKTDFNRHLQTQKHKNIKIISETRDILKSIKSKKNEKNDNNNDKKHCEYCNNSYSSRQSLWRHKKICNIQKNQIYEISILANNIDKQQNTVTTTCNSNEVPYVNGIDISNNIVIDKNLFLTLVKDNNELKQMMLEQNKHILELSKNNTITNTNITNTNTHNNFNLNFFLNEQCKDAINWSDFIKKIEVSYEDLENNAQLGFVKGISKILIDNLNQLTVYERPIHCTDVKRETMYIKEEDEWKREQDHSKISDAIQEVSRKSICSLIEWKQDNPEYDDLDSDFSQKCIVIQRQSVAGSQRDFFYSKIKQNIAKETIIDKKI